MSASVWATTTKISGSTLSASQSFTAVQGQDTFNITGYIYVPYTGALELYKNGLHLVLNVDWVEVSTGDSFSITSAATAGDIYTAVASVGISAVVPGDIGFQAQLDAEQAARILKDDLLKAEIDAHTGNIATNAGNAATNASDITAIEAVDVTQNSRLTANETTIASLIAGQTGGIIVFTTYALLNAYTPTTAEENTSFKVTNDPTSNLNGYYSWVSGTTYTKDSDLVVNVIDPNNTSDGVSGSAVFNEIHKDSSNTNLQSNYKWGLGLGDADIPFNVYTSNVGSSSVEADNTVFNYDGSCLKGIASGTRIYIDNFSLSDIPVRMRSSLRIIFEVYLPVGATATLSLFAKLNGAETGITNFSITSGVSILEHIFDITGLSNFERPGLYFNNVNGTLTDYRVGRVFLGDRKAGSLEGNNIIIKDAIDKSIVANNESITDLPVFTDQVKTKYMKTEQLLSNASGVIFDQLDSIPQLSNDTTYSEYTLPTDTGLPFTKGVNFLAASLGNSSKVGFQVKLPYSPKVYISMWCEVFNSDTFGSDISFYFRYKKGYNNQTVKTYNPVVTKGYFAAIELATVNGGTWELANSDGVIKSQGIRTINGRKMVHVSYEMDSDAPYDSDYIEVNYGRSSNFNSGSNVDVLYFGFQSSPTKLHNQFNSSINFRSLSEQSTIDDIDKNLKLQSYKLNNKFVDFIAGGGNIYASDGISSAQYNNGFLTRYTGVTVAETVLSNKFGTGYRLDYNGGANFPKYVSHSVRNTILEFTLDTSITVSEENEAVLGFWIDRRELNGNGIVHHEGSGGSWFVENDELLFEGFNESRVGSVSDPSVPYISVVKIDGHFTYLQWNIYNSGRFIFAINNESTNEVTQLTIYNPTLIYNKNLDPYHTYQSRSEKENSQHIGKKLLLIGDSQYNDVEAAKELADSFGTSIVSCHRGGHSMKIRSSQLGNTNYSSFYHTNLRDEVLSHTDIDIYLITCSTNDGSGGGDLSESAVQYVLDNYPVYGDDAGVTASKQALFNALTNSEVDTGFNFKNCYSAYLKQIQSNYPLAQVVISSIPISATGKLTGGVDGNGYGIWVTGESPDTARASLDSGRQAIRNDVLSISSKHNTCFADALNEVNLTYENFTAYCTDGTHWNPRIKTRIAGSISTQVKKLRV